MFLIAFLVLAAIVLSGVFVVGPRMEDALLENPRAADPS
jgi:uncharacterized protein YneF (UPF0154 family)